MPDPTQSETEAQSELNRIYVAIARLDSEISSAHFKADLTYGAITNKQPNHAGNFVDGMSAAASIGGLEERREKLRQRKDELESQLLEAGRTKYRIDYTAYLRHSDGSASGRSRGADLVAASPADAIICLKDRVGPSWPDYPFMVSENGVELSDEQVARLKSADIGYGHEQDPPLVRIEQVKSNS